MHPYSKWKIESLSGTDQKLVLLSWAGTLLVGVEGKEGYQDKSILVPGDNLELR